MIGLIVGSISFGIMLLFDLAALAKKVVLRYSLLVISLASLGYGIYDLMQYNNTFQISFGLLPVLIVLDFLFFLLLIYSVVIEVQINQTLIGNETKLTTSGTYYLSRHPGVLWLFIVLALSATILGNYIFLIGAVVFTIANSIYVYYQEKWVLVKLFKDYSQYQQTTPMLIPTIQSIKNFAKRTLEE